LILRGARHDGAHTRHRVDAYDHRWTQLHVCRLARNGCADFRIGATSWCRPVAGAGGWIVVAERRTRASMGHRISAGLAGGVVLALGTVVLSTRSGAGGS